MKNSEMTQREVATRKKWVAEELKESIMKGMNECAESRMMCPAVYRMLEWIMALYIKHRLQNI